MKNLQSAQLGAFLLMEINDDYSTYMVTYDHSHSNWVWNFG